jgi:modulator of FtsH protease HflC
MSRTRAAWIVLGLAVLAIVVSESIFFAVQQTEIVLITQFGRPIRVITEPGLRAKVPLLQQAIVFDRRLLDYEAPSEEAILGDQRRVIVDSFTRYRITDPLRYYQSVGPGEDGLRARLNAVVTSSMRRVLGSESLLDVVSGQRDRIMGAIRAQVAQEMRGFGVDVVDVRIRRADLPAENTQAILQRMQSERERVAKQARAEGAEAAARIRAEADRQKTVILAEARATAERLHGEGEAGATDRLAASAARDPGFFTLWRTYQAYQDIARRGHARLVLAPTSAFLQPLAGPKP